LLFIYLFIFIYLDSAYKRKRGVCLYESGLFHLT
jgi:hypothetical protein